MPQRHLPLFPQGVIHITLELAFMKEGGRVTYFNGHMPVFIHEEGDKATFRMITSQFCVNGNARQADIVRAFGVTTIRVKRSVKLYREKGPRGFYAPRPPRAPAVLIEPVVAEIEEFLDAGMSEAEIAQRLGLKRDTLHKAVRAGRIRAPAKNKDLPPCNEPLASTKSARAELDCAAPMGRGATATLERLAASLGQLGAMAPRFEDALDIPKGGVLLALPALLVCGLLRHAGQYFQLPPGFYGLETIFLLLAFMALARLKSIEALRYCAPGEWGKLLGLDRIPEVRTPRAKLKHLAEQGQAFEWSTALCTEWMAATPEEAAVLDVDGQVRKKLGILSRKRAEFGALNLEGEIEPIKVETFERRKAELQECIAALQEEVAALKAERKATKRHIPFYDLPEEERFQRLSTQSKHFVDTIKRIAYRAETAMAQTLREKMARYDDARSLLRAVYRSEIDLLPNAQEKTLTVRLHPLANESSDDAVRHLCSLA